MFREAQAICTESRLTGAPVDEVTEMRAERTMKARETRREFLQTAGMAAAAVVASSVMPSGMQAAGKLGKVVIVGGGVAGLRCAHRLWTKWGRASTVYEWDDHVGGRIDTFYNFNQRLPGQGPTFFANGEYVELHGEYVSSEHSEMIGLANRYGLQLDIASTNQSVPAFPPGTVDVYWFNGAYYTRAARGRLEELRLERLQQGRPRSALCALLQLQEQPNRRFLGQHVSAGLDQPKCPRRHEHTVRKTLLPGRHQ